MVRSTLDMTYVVEKVIVSHRHIVNSCFYSNKCTFSIFILAVIFYIRTVFLFLKYYSEDMCGVITQIRNIFTFNVQLMYAVEVTSSRLTYI